MLKGSRKIQPEEARQVAESDANMTKVVRVMRWGM